MDIKIDSQIDSVFQTDDILFTAYLLTQNIPLVNIQEDKPRHFTFVLSNTEKCQELKQQFLNNAPAPARVLFANREMLISEIKTRGKIGGNYGEWK